MSTQPNLRQERALLRDGAQSVAGMDEVGRGALSGPVSVGVVVVDLSHRALSGVRDSKLLSAAAREDLVPRIKAWAGAFAVGHASAAEIDAHGIVMALRLAGMRALELLAVPPHVVILDGRHDWLTPAPQGSLWDDVPTAASPPVVTRVKADLTCTSVAAASVLAKVERDAIMCDLDHRHPGYGWADNKGYAAPEHIEELRRRGPSPQHRQSWRLPGVPAD